MNVEVQWFMDKCNKQTTFKTVLFFKFVSVVVVTAISTGLVDKSGRRVLLIISCSVMTISLLLVATAFYLQGIVANDSGIHRIMGVLSLVGLLVLVIGFSLGVGPIPWLIMSEILPLNIKGLAGSAATFLNWFTASLVTLTAKSLLNWSHAGAFTIYAIFAAINLAFTLLWVPETKDKTLEEIQASFRR
ncbi:unnamed protein product [Vicia faba]|uniref:Major facilitator superfamily (MFS) profile domain-containing protein n=1 Tax=Vicia faba TaxID=3906 RepID=A0AAV1AFA1_VICFA|nr:unnamed protein product [Vicia faba]